MGTVASKLPLKTHTPRACRNDSVSDTWTINIHENSCQAYF